MNSSNFETSDIMKTQYNVLRDETILLFSNQKNLLIEDMNELLKLSSNFMSSENYQKFKLSFDSIFFEKQSNFQQFLNNKEAQYSKMLDYIIKLEIDLSKDITNKLVTSNHCWLNNLRDKTIKELHSELKDAVITKHLDLIHIQANLIAEQNKELDRIKGNFEKILKKSNKITDKVEDIKTKKENQTNETIEINNIIDSNLNDQILYNNRNKIIKNYPNRIKKINKKSEQSSFEVNPNGIETNKCDKEKETLNKYIEINKQMRDIDNSIDLNRNNSIDSVSKNHDSDNSSMKIKNSSSKLSQSLIKSSNHYLEKENVNKENSSKNIISLNKSEEEVISNKKFITEKISKQKTSRNSFLNNNISENKSRTHSKKSTLTARSISPTNQSISYNNKLIKDKNTQTKYQKNFGKFINANKNSSITNKNSDTVNSRDDSATFLTKIETKYKKKDSIEKKVFPPCRSPSSAMTKKTNINTLLKTIKNQDNGIKETISNNDTANNSILSIGNEAKVSRFKQNKTKSNGKLEPKNLKLPGKTGNTSYTEQLLNKYYQFLDTINKNYEIDNETQCNRKKDKKEDLKNIFTIKEEIQSTKNENLEI